MEAKISDIVRRFFDEAGRSYGYCNCEDYCRCNESASLEDSDDNRRLLANIIKQVML